LIPADKLRELNELDSEDTSSHTSLPDEWPNRGAIQFSGFSTDQNPDSDLFIHNLNVEISPTQKVVVVGKGHSGKDAITASLFRMIEPTSGQLLIDDLGLNLIGLKDLRNRLSIVSGIPILFSDTLRFNLDPINKHTDAELWIALKSVRLDEFISEKWTDALSHKIDVDNDFSLHQKWMLNLARTLLNKSKVIVVDEPRMAIGESTMAAIHEVLHKEASTLITITSNFRSTLYNDMTVLLLDHGEMKGFALPHKLLNEENSLFRSFIQ
jgi:ABC-type multidrug transport system fused ATPase/permease subunit